MMQRDLDQQVLARLVRGPALLARGLIQVYRHTLSGLIGLECRHLPTCSSYADEAIGRFGLWAGGWMTLARLGRCHPFGTSGLDFVPASLPEHSRWYLPWRYGRWQGINDAIDPAPPGGPDRRVGSGRCTADDHRISRGRATFNGRDGAARTDTPAIQDPSGHAYLHS